MTPNNNVGDFLSDQNDKKNDYLGEIICSL